MNLKKLFAVAITAMSLISPSLAQSEIKTGKALQITIQGVPTEEKQKIDGQYMVTDSGAVNMSHPCRGNAAG